MAKKFFKKLKKVAKVALPIAAAFYGAPMLAGKLGIGAAAGAAGAAGSAGATAGWGSAAMGLAKAAAPSLITAGIGARTASRAQKASMQAEAQAQQQAQNDEAMRLQRYNQASSAINGVFGNRDGLYSGLRNDVFNNNKMQVEREAQDAQRQLEFNMARNGLAGGSAHAGQNAEVGRIKNQGLLRAGTVADQAAMDWRASDEGARGELLQLAQGGADTATAQTAAMQRLKANEARTAAARTGSAVGGLFSGLADAYTARQQLAGGGGVFGSDNTNQRRPYNGTLIG